ncbi:MAG: hypothetical protein M0R20_04475 [Candidatus Omnitrophica bacterium]|jgi:hypothetical protein|nr:hypothetical protein [Candidatus Omnitrophota bacterium]
MSKFLATIISFFVFAFIHYIVKNILIRLGIFMVFTTNTTIDNVSGSLYGVSVITGFIAGLYAATKVYKKLTLNSHKNVK